MPITTIRRAIIKAFDAATYTATVQIIGSLPSYLAGVPVTHHLRANLLVAGAKCGVTFFDEANPTDAAVTVLFGGSPATTDFDVDGNLNVDGLITVAGVVDGVDVSSHVHSGAGQGGTVGHGSLSSVTADQHHVQIHTHVSHTGIGANDHHAQVHAVEGADHTGSVDHVNLANKGTNTHLTIDTHIAAAQSRARRYLLARTTNLTSGLLTQINLDTENFDTLNEFSNYKFTATLTGYYQINASLHFENMNSGDQGILEVQKNVTHTAIISASVFASAVMGLSVTVSDISYLVAGDYIELYAIYNYSAEADHYIYGDSRGIVTYLSVHRLS